MLPIVLSGFFVLIVIAKIVKLYSEIFKKRPLLLIQPVALLCVDLAVVVLEF